MRISWFGWMIGLMLCFFLVPTLLVNWTTPAIWQKAEPVIAQQAQQKVKVYLVDEHRTITLPLEQYVAGVVAAEMPIEFAFEALKAQALTARTYIAKRLEEDRSDMRRWGADAAEAMVTDTVQHQAYITEQKLRSKWGNHFRENWNKVRKAVTETEGQIIAYRDKPIYAAFFSTSNGYTENAEDYFSNAYPYLRSVPSPWDRQSPKYRHLTRTTIQQMIHKLEAKTGRKISLSASKMTPIAQIQALTAGKRVARMKIGDQTFTGREVRDALQLPSSDFTCWRRGKQVWILSHGYGHGVGMSQWGANYMAEQGNTAAQIIAHYYPGVQIKGL
ncbi:stage II sporulation protein D [Seinonella peptonophila]|uniref:Stage II sporulation protein D n=1 Tax=Seinonella peptonophila TaxID=112248 RepID=A0A1M4XSF5_9BACL|nr:stage II sporulation protein D [Seinonella peptonophila]SHE96497.1 stage II sporulation protein D [Seinonella peptonophila]